jgi:hypothetical protein
MNKQQNNSDKTVLKKSMKAMVSGITGSSPASEEANLVQNLMARSKQSENC